MVFKTFFLHKFNMYNIYLKMKFFILVQHLIIIPFHRSTARYLFIKEVDMVYYINKNDFIGKILRPCRILGFC